FLRPRRGRGSIGVVHRDLDAEERRVHLRAEGIGLAGTAGWASPPDSELDRLRRVEGREADHVLDRDVVELGDALRGERLAPLRRLVVARLPEDDVEGDVVDPGVLAPDRRRHVPQLHRGAGLSCHRISYPPTVSSRVRKSSRGSLTGNTWATVHW